MTLASSLPPAPQNARRRAQDCADHTECGWLRGGRDRDENEKQEGKGTQGRRTSNTGENCDPFDRLPSVTLDIFRQSDSLERGAVVLMSPECLSETFVFTHPGGASYQTTVTADAREIRWTNRTGSGTIAYRDITAIELIVGDPDPGERDDSCAIWTATGRSLRVYCEAGSSSRAKDRPARLEVYSNFVRFLHRQLSPEDRRRIAFKTDGKLSPKAQRFLVAGILVSSILLVTLFILLGHAQSGEMTFDPPGIPLALGLGYLLLNVAYGIAIHKRFPKEPRTYCPDPLDERFLP